MGRGGSGPHKSCILAPYRNQISLGRLQVYACVEWHLAVRLEINAHEIIRWKEDSRKIYHDCDNVLITVARSGGESLPYTLVEIVSFFAVIREGQELGARFNNCRHPDLASKNSFFACLFGVSSLA